MEKNQTSVALGALSSLEEHYWSIAEDYYRVFKDVSAYNADAIKVALATKKGSTLAVLAKSKKIHERDIDRARRILIDKEIMKQYGK